MSGNERTTEAREQLAEAVAAMADGDRFAAYLRAAAVFHNYSLNNQMLIACQCPEATQVAGYRAWQKLGRQVRKGEKSIAILAPMGGKKVDAGPSAVGYVCSWVDGDADRVRELATRIDTAVAAILGRKKEAKAA